jgi:hypothetical protein
MEFPIPARDNPPGGPMTIYSAVIDAERRLFAVCLNGEAGSTLETYDLETAALRQRIPGLPRSAVNISLHPGGSFLALAGSDELLEIRAFPG